MSEVSAAAPSADLSFLGLFLHAPFVVQVVMVGLLLASVWGWAVIIEKTILFSTTRQESEDFEKLFWSGQSLDELYNILSTKRPSAMSSLFIAAMREWRRSIEGTARPLAGVQQRIERVMDVAITRETERLERRLLFLATVGSTAPFVGLFGTVIGIMASFQSMSTMTTVSFNVVAPNISEALAATALGLLAAIPAVIFYNKFATEAGRFAQRFEGFSDEFLAIVSRQIDMRT
jgi:biopolymer transport protein TolQ